MLVLVVGAVAAAALGVLRLPGSADSTRPPCAQLPTVVAVERALSVNPTLVERIEAVGDGVEVSVAQPCEEPERALVRVTFSSEVERTGVDAILREDGFGMPVELVGRR